MKERRGRSGVKLKYTRRQENKGGRGGGGRSVLHSTGGDRGEVLAGRLAEEITAFNGVSLSLIISKTTFPGAHLTVCLCHGWETSLLTAIFNF